ncbi:MAG: hypothetical protein ACOY5B_12605 [Spirochaetota bacterium]
MKKCLTIIMTVAACCATLSFFAGCKNPVRALERKTILKRMWSLTSLTGVYTETGIANEPQQTEIFWRAEPPAVLARVISPAQNKGNLLHYTAGTLSLYFPRTSFGIRYSHVPELDATRQAQWLESEYDWHVAHYDITQIDDGAVAGYPTVGVRYVPNTTFALSPFSHEWRAAVYGEFAFALETTAYRAGREVYRLRFDRAEFQPAVNSQISAFRFPAGTTLGEYEFAGNNLTPAAAKAGANFALRIPQPREGFALNRIVRAKGLIPAYTLYFENLPYQTFYTQVRDYGLKLVPEQGLRIAGKRQYHVQFAGSFRTIWFLEKNVYHTIVSSRPLSEVLTWLEQP